MESDLRTLALADAALSALIGARLTPLVMPEAPTLPAIVYQRISTEHVHSHSGVSGYGIARVQFACYGKTYQSALNVADALRAAIDGFAGDQTPASPSTALGTYFAGIHLLDERDGYEAEALLWRKDLDFRVQWEYDSIPR